MSCSVFRLSNSNTCNTDDTSYHNDRAALLIPLIRTIQHTHTIDAEAGPRGEQNVHWIQHTHRPDRVRKVVHIRVRSGDSFRRLLHVARVHSSDSAEQLNLRGGKEHLKTMFQCVVGRPNPP